MVETVSRDLLQYRIGVLPDLVKEANRNAHKAMLDRQMLGLLVSQAVALGVHPEGFEAFVTAHSAALLKLSEQHPRTLAERMGKAESRYRFL